MNECNTTYQYTKGGGLYAFTGASFEGCNNILYGNAAYANPEFMGTINFDYSCCSTALSGTGNITSNPQFVNPTEFNFSLQSGSPCIDTGDPGTPPDEDGTRADMGGLYYDQGGSAPAMSIELTYVSGSPVPAGGGNLTFDVYAANTGAVALAFDAWLEISFAGGPAATVVKRSFTEYQPGWTINRPNSWYPIPAGYAAGSYEMVGKVGVNPIIAWDESSFAFEKTGDGDAYGFVPYPVDGAPNPFEVSESDATTMPDRFMLTGNYPNPFNPTTCIGFALPEGALTQLAVFDLAGRQVAEVVNGYRTAGYHEVNFDASSLTSGVYIYRLHAGEFSASGKMILMK